MPPWVATHPTARASQPPVLVQGARPGAPHPPGAAPDFPLVPGMALRRAEEPASDPAPQVSAPDRAAAGRPGWAGGLRRPASLCRLGYAPAPPGQTGRAERDHRGLVSPGPAPRGAPPRVSGAAADLRATSCSAAAVELRQPAWVYRPPPNCRPDPEPGGRYPSSGSCPGDEPPRPAPAPTQPRVRRVPALPCAAAASGSAPGRAQLVGPLGGIGGQPQCEA